MAQVSKNLEHRYVNDLRRLKFSNTQVTKAHGSIFLAGIALLFLTLIAVFADDQFGIAAAWASLCRSLQLCFMRLFGFYTPKL